MIFWKEVLKYFIGGQKQIKCLADLVPKYLGYWNSIQVHHVGGRQGLNYLSHHFLAPRICNSRKQDSYQVLDNHCSKMPIPHSTQFKNIPHITAIKTARCWHIGKTPRWMGLYIDWWDSIKNWEIDLYKSTQWLQAFGLAVKTPVGKSVSHIWKSLLNSWFCFRVQPMRDNTRMAQRGSFPSLCGRLQGVPSSFLEPLLLQACLSVPP